MECVPKFETFHCCRIAKLRTMRVRSTTALPCRKLTSVLPWDRSILCTKSRMLLFFSQSTFRVYLWHLTCRLLCVGGCKFSAFYVVDASACLSGQVLRRIRINLAWSFVYNMIFIALAAGVWYVPWKVTIPPPLGAFLQVCGHSIAY